MTTMRLPALYGGFAFKVALALALAGLGDVLFFQHRLYNGWFGIFGGALLAVLVAARPAVWRSRRALLAAGAAGLSALAMAIDPSPLAFLLFWIAAGLATLLPGTARFDDGWRWFQRLVAHGFLSAFGPLLDLIKFQRARRRYPQNRVGLRTIAGALIVPLLGSALFVALFSSANPVIERFLASLSVPQLDDQTIVRIALWALLLLMAWSLLRPRLVRRLLPKLSGNAASPLPGITPASVLLSLALFNLLFALQNGMDLAWLWGLLPLPKGMTLADYAHRGAYPLIVTALLAGLFVLVALRPGSATASVRAIRWLVVAWIAQNLVLVSSSILRTLDYVETYSLTQLRIAALAWMVLVAVGLVLICWRLLRGRSGAWLINANLAATALLLGAYAFVDTGALAARWNVRHAREIDGTGAQLDLCYLESLGGSALLPLIELEQAPLPAKLHTEVSQTRQGLHWRLLDERDNGGWTWLNARRLDRAAALIAAANLPAPSNQYGRCYD